MNIKLIPVSLFLGVILLSGCSESTRSSNSSVDSTPATTTGTPIEAKRVASAPVASPASESIVAIIETPEPEPIVAIVETPEPKAEQIATVVETTKQEAKPEETLNLEPGTRPYERSRTFDRYDADKDGFLSLAELTASMQKWMDDEGFNEGRQGKQVDYALNRRDSDGDGKLTKTEFIQF